MFRVSCIQLCSSDNVEYNLDRTKKLILKAVKHRANLILTPEVSSKKTVLLAGNVQNTSLVPAEKLTAESELELLIIVVLLKVSGEASVTVPMPTSNSSAD